MQRYTEEQKLSIIGEYQSAVAAGEGGGGAVAIKYKVHPSQIISWAKRRGARSAARVYERNVGAPVQGFAEAVSKLISYHRRQIERLEAMSKGYAA